VVRAECAWFIGRGRVMTCLLGRPDRLAIAPLAQQSTRCTTATMINNPPINPMQSFRFKHTGGIQHGDDRK
jgi:hypothetical protein